MSMLQILVLIIGAIGGASGLYTIYTANAKKESITIGNLEKVIKDMRIEISSLQEKVNRLEIEQDIYKKSISYGYKCSYCGDNVCPIVKAIDFESKKL